MKAKPHSVLMPRRELNSLRLRRVRDLGVRRQLHGACSAASVIGFRGRHNAACLLQVAQPSSSSSPRAQCSQAALFGAQLRSSSPQKVACIGATTCNAQRRIAVKLPSTLCGPSVPVRGCPLSNWRLVPTAQSRAPLGPRAASGAAAAQPGRWVARKSS